MFNWLLGGSSTTNTFLQMLPRLSLSTYTHRAVVSFVVEMGSFETESRPRPKESRIQVTTETMKICSLTRTRGQIPRKYGLDLEQVVLDYNTCSWGWAGVLTGWGPKSPPPGVYDVLLSRYSSGPSFSVYLWEFLLWEVFYHLASENYVWFCWKAIALKPHKLMHHWCL